MRLCHVSIANGSTSSELVVVIYRPQGVVAYRGSSVVRHILRGIL